MRNDCASPPLFNGNGFHIFQNAWAIKPIHAMAALHNIVAIDRDHGNKIKGGSFQFLCQWRELLLDRLEYILLKANHIHFVNRDHDVSNSKKPRNAGMAGGLRQHAFAGVHKNESQVRIGRAGCHIARVLFVAGSIGNDELAFFSCEITVRNINGDALFPLCPKTVC